MAARVPTRGIRYMDRGWREVRVLESWRCVADLSLSKVSKLLAEVVVAHGDASTFAGKVP